MQIACQTSCMHAQTYCAALRSPSCWNYMCKPIDALSIGSCAAQVWRPKDSNQSIWEPEHPCKAEKSLSTAFKNAGHGGVSGTCLHCCRLPAALNPRPKHMLSHPDASNDKKTHWPATIDTMCHVQALEILACVTPTYSMHYIMSSTTRMSKG